MNKTIIIIAHPMFDKSVVTRMLVDKIVNLKPEIDTRIISKDGKFNIDEEQKIVLNYENIVFAFPIWWYGAPWNLKKYFDEVITPGFAFSFKGEIKDFKLLNKRFSMLISVGNSEDTYKEGALNHHTIETYTSSLKALFTLVGSAPGIKGKDIPEEKYFIKPGIVYGSALPEIDSNIETTTVANEFVKRL